MSGTASSAPPPPPKRHITTLLPTGLSAFAALPLNPPTTVYSGGASIFHLAYASDNNSAGRPDPNTDLAQYEAYSINPPPVVNDKGTTVRVIDMAPQSSSPMHRTVSIDYAVVLTGSVTLVLDGGESRVLGPGEVVVQRGTGHAWKNESSTEWARMMFVVVSCEPIVAGGKIIGDYMGENKAVEDVKLA